MDPHDDWNLRPVAEPVSYYDTDTRQWTSGSFDTAMKSEHPAVVTSSDTPAAASSAFAAAAQHDTPADTPVDDLQRMLADKAARRVADEQTRMRIAAEVDVLMDNGVRIHPLCEQMYGGDRSGEAAPAPSPGASAAQPVGSAAAQSSAPGGTVDELEFDEDDY